MLFNIEYDETDPKSIESYAQKLIGYTFKQMCAQYGNKVDYSVNEKKARKGGLGDLVEEVYFKYENNSDSRPDFYKAGVELKVTPYKINQDGSKSAKERLIITMIDYCQVVNETFENSHLWYKAHLMLIIYYLYQQSVTSRLDYRIDYARLFSPPEQDLAIIKSDFEKIVAKIKAGKAHELSEGDTLYLGAATKSSDSTKRRAQPFSDIPAKPRAFSYKTSYMTHVLNNYIIPGKNGYESILKDSVVPDFELYVQQKINTYAGKSQEELSLLFEIDNPQKKKNLGAMLAFRMLGIKSNNAEEFSKANIVVKTIRLNKDNKIKENMSFPNFKFTEIINEEWEDAAFPTLLRETKFLFVIYKFSDSGDLILKGCQFWNMPDTTIESDVKTVWSKTKQLISDGLQFEIVNGEYHSNLPKQTENPVCHVRPHGRNSKDTYDLPDGRAYPKQCFWLNNSYIKDQLDDSFFS